MHPQHTHTILHPQSPYLPCSSCILLPFCLHKTTSPTSFILLQHHELKAPAPPLPSAFSSQASSPSALFCPCFDLTLNSRGQAARPRFLSSVPKSHDSGWLEDGTLGAVGCSALGCSMGSPHSGPFHPCLPPQPDSELADDEWNAQMEAVNHAGQSQKAGGQEEGITPVLKATQLPAQTRFTFGGRILPALSTESPALSV